MSGREPYARSAFRRARRRRAFRWLTGRLRRREPDPLLSLDDVRRRVRAFEQSYSGVRPILVSKIVGTISRTGDFDRDFLPRRAGIEERWKRVEQSFAEGEFPPITVYELSGSFFVVDGHHRVAIARQRGVEYIDAEVTRLRSRWPLPEGADISQLIMAEQQGVFMEESGLDRARPEARIQFTRPQGYIELLEHIKIHGYHLMLERDAVLTPSEMAADWYDRVYLPTVRAIKREGLWDRWPRATKADLFLWVSQHRRELYPERGGMDIDQAVAAALESSRRRRPPATTRLVRKRDGQGERAETDS